VSKLRSGHQQKGWVLIVLSFVTMVGILTLRSRTREDAYTGWEQLSGNSIQVSWIPASEHCCFTVDGPIIM